MCHERRDYGLEEETARRLQLNEEEEAREEARRRGREARRGSRKPEYRRAGEREKNLLTEKVREMVTSPR
jgi:hypothetical protein